MRAASWQALASCSLLLLAEAAMPSPASARRTQAQLTATFKDRADDSAPHASPGPACTIAFTRISDERRSPEMAGVIGQRGVLAPVDVDMWLRAVLGGLTPRGIRPVFGSDAAAEATAPTATFALQTAWISSTDVTYTGAVAIHLTAQGAGETVIDKIYRGRATRTAYWSGGVDTLQSAMDGAFADALDAMAIDLGKACDGPAR